MPDRFHIRLAALLELRAMLATLPHVVTPWT